MNVLLPHMKILVSRPKNAHLRLHLFLRPKLDVDGPMRILAILLTRQLLLLVAVSILAPRYPLEMLMTGQLITRLLQLTRFRLVRRFLRRSPPLPRDTTSFR